MRGAEGDWAEAGCMTKAVSAQSTKVTGLVIMTSITYQRSQIRPWTELTRPNNEIIYFEPDIRQYALAFGIN